VIVDSGTDNHTHVDVVLNMATDVDTADRLTKALAKATKAQGQSGTKFEDNALLRWPGSYNYKDKENPNPVKVHVGDVGPTVWGIDELEALVSSLTTSKSKTHSHTQDDIPLAYGVTQTLLNSHQCESLRNCLDRWDMNDNSGSSAAAVKESCRANLTVNEMSSILWHDGRHKRKTFPLVVKDVRDTIANEELTPGDKPSDSLGKDTAVTVLMSDVEEKPIRWLWYGWLIEGKNVVLEGDMDQTKSTLALTMGAHVTTGKSWPDGSQCPQGNVVVMSAEDDAADTIKPRLRLAGADLSRVRQYTRVKGADGKLRLPKLSDVEVMRDLIVEFSAKFLIVDVLPAYLDKNTNAYVDQDVREALYPLSEIAAETGCTILLIRHTRKSGDSKKATHAGGGSIGIGGAARSVIRLDTDPDDDQYHIMSSVKMNLTKKPRSRRYEIEEPEGEQHVRIEWHGESDHTADSLMLQQTAKPTTKRDKAQSDLEELLSTREGTVDAKEGLAIMTGAGYSENAVYRARQALGIKSKRSGGIWTWTYK
jgi:hypothetical protein